MWSTRRIVFPAAFLTLSINPLFICVSVAMRTRNFDGRQEAVLGCVKRSCRLTGQLLFALETFIDQGQEHAIDIGLELWIR